MGRPLHEGLAASNRLIARQTRGIPAEGTTYAKALRQNRAGPSTAAPGTYDGRAAGGWDDGGGAGRPDHQEPGHPWARGVIRGVKQAEALNEENRKTEIQRECRS